ncbi:MAG TPA: hypothetical protein VM802_11955 [Chitinophaga sp.]|uniref:CBU_0592 family membrane protein n=1 Tax=Chitinophaga sp. TaxID=1869181 RepID=UPI002D0A1814|nr:hypothetical protein [Chitinophaga sp.]HVI45582.1 hypothetical protein [Chitinophaga sp.]
MDTSIAAAVGWTGAILYIVAYLLLSTGKLKADTIIYHVLNILGALGLIFNAFVQKDPPNIIVNLVWLAIAMFAIYDKRAKTTNSKESGQ